MGGDVPAMTELQFPIGPFRYDGPSTESQRQRFIEEIHSTPRRLREVVTGLSDEQLDTPYRPGGWTVRQVVHHLADSHTNGHVRLRLALTEDNPTIGTYKEYRWAELVDARTGPIELSLRLLEALHQRWVMLMRSLTPEDLARPFVHPEFGQVTTDFILSLYAWHGRHHVAHIASLRDRRGW